LAAAAVEHSGSRIGEKRAATQESAKQAATQNVTHGSVALRDTEVGRQNHVHQRINTAFTAIRESADFSGGVMGRSIPRDRERLIEVHQTSVLQEWDTSQLTSARAVEGVLKFRARRRLVNTDRGGPWSAEATMILA